MHLDSWRALKRWRVSNQNLPSRRILCQQEHAQLSFHWRRLIADVEQASILVCCEIRSYYIDQACEAVAVQLRESGWPCMATLAATTQHRVDLQATDFVAHKHLQAGEYESHRPSRASDIMKTYQ